MSSRRNPGFRPLEECAKTGTQLPLIGRREMATQTASTKIGAPNRLKGKVAIITGGDQGNRQAIALRFAADGADIAFRYRSNRTEADDVVRSHSIWRSREWLRDAERSLTRPTSTTLGRCEHSSMPSLINSETPISGRQVPD